MRDPFFWTTLALFGWFLTPLVVGSKVLGRRAVIGYACSAFIALPVFLLPLSFVIQPRFELVLLRWAGLPITAAGLAIMLPTFFRVRPFTGPRRDEPLRTTGVYGLVRHPMMFGGMLSVLGWSWVWGSLTGTGLAVVYGLCGWLSSFPEEERLLEEYGDDYTRYQRRVPRFFPVPRPGERE